MSTFALGDKALYLAGNNLEVEVVGFVDWESSEFDDPGLELVVRGPFSHGHSCHGMHSHITWVQPDYRIDSRHRYVTAEELSHLPLVSAEPTSTLRNIPLGAYVRLEGSSRLYLLAAKSHTWGYSSVIFGTQFAGVDSVGHGAFGAENTATWVAEHHWGNRAERFRNQGYWYVDLDQLTHVPVPTVEELQDLVF